MSETAYPIARPSTRTRWKADSQTHRSPGPAAVEKYIFDPHAFGPTILRAMSVRSPFHLPPQASCRNAAQKLYTRLDRLTALISDYTNQKWTKTWEIVHLLPIVLNIIACKCAITSRLRQRRIGASPEKQCFVLLAPWEETVAIDATDAARTEGER